MKALTEIKLTPADYDTFKPYFPNTVHELITVCGETATFALINQCTGQGISIGKNQKEKGKILFQKLAAIVGEPAAHKLTVAYGTQRLIYVPRCQKIKLLKRNKIIKKQFDELTRTQTASQVISLFVKELNLSERAIRNIVNSPDE